MAQPPYTPRKARPRVPRDKAWIVLDGSGRMVPDLGRMTEAEARAAAERLNAAHERPDPRSS